MAPPNQPFELIITEPIWWFVILIFVVMIGGAILSALSEYRTKALSKPRTDFKSSSVVTRVRSFFGAKIKTGRKPDVS
jgi:hypothetical protein